MIIPEQGLAEMTTNCHARDLQLESLLLYFWINLRCVNTTKRMIPQRMPLFLHQRSGTGRGLIICNPLVSSLGGRSEDGLIGFHRTDLLFIINQHPNIPFELEALELDPVSVRRAGLLQSYGPSFTFFLYRFYPFTLFTMGIH